MAKYQIVDDPETNNLWLVNLDTHTAEYLDRDLIGSLGLAGQEFLSSINRIAGMTPGCTGRNDASDRALSFDKRSDASDRALFFDNRSDTSDHALSFDRRSDASDRMFSFDGLSNASDRSISTHHAGLN
ncbi:hypothetical protein HQ945_04835 [Phyllobacterium sp. BT25]|uniref:Uncharacterized protein n=1 Tax=Phyllobacterium pellucidum TaxID=2740464 RepID=A0A849VRR3_9HYPH|nr:MULTISPECIES: hypothetical protein [Phyllobacterium]NTS30573.1 hypothetical protein [Phyllobacterium pellucidum]